MKMRDDRCRLFSRCISHDEEAISQRLADLGAQYGSTTMLRLVEIFLEDFSARLSDLCAAADTGDQQAMLALTHTLKSSAGNLHAKTLWEFCFAMERALRENSALDYAHQIDSIRREYAAVEALLRREQLPRQTESPMTQR